MARDAFRYYAYSPDMGRRRVTGPDEAAIIEWAAGRGAVNVVREDGPASKPTAITMIWKRQEDPFGPTLNDRLWAILEEHFPHAPMKKVGALIKDIEAAIKEQEE